MRRISQTVSGVNVSNPVPLDHYLTPFNIGLCVIVTGSVTYTVQHTFDDLQAVGYTPASGTWFNHPDMTSQTTTKDANYAFPVTAIRVSTAAGSTGSVNFVVIQAGLVGA